MVHDGAGWRIVELLPSLEEDSRVDPFLDHDEGKARTVLVAYVVECVFELFRLICGRKRELAVPNTVSEHDDLVRPNVVCLVELPQGLDESDLKTVDQLLAGCLEHSGAEPLTHGHVGAAHHACYAGAPPGGVVIHVNTEHHDIAHLEMNLAILRRA